MSKNFRSVKILLIALASSILFNQAFGTPIQCGPLIAAGSDHLRFAQAPVGIHSVVMDTNLAAHFFYTELFLELNFIGIKVTELAQNWKEHRQPIKIGARMLSERQAERLFKMVETHHRFQGPRVMVEAGLHYFFEDSNLRNFQPHLLNRKRRDHPFPTTVISEILQQDFEFHPESFSWRPKSGEGLLPILMEPLLSTTHPTYYDYWEELLSRPLETLKNYTPPARSGVLGNFSVLKPDDSLDPFRSSNDLLRHHIVNILAEHQVGGGAKGVNDREIIAETLLAQRAQELLDLSLPPVFLTLDIGIVKGLLRLKLRNLIKNRDRRENQIKAILAAIENKAPFQETLTDLIGVKVEDYKIEEFHSGPLFGLPGKPKTLRVILVEGIRISRPELEATIRSVDDSDIDDLVLSLPLELDLLFFKTLDSEPFFFD